ncbi:MAG TPA: ATP-dependent DNA helicase RecQ, partial [Rhodospirillales bacterium]|nr:ATP-dependent DNA helicase RecQ [Rhodospirillales bacterium]
NAHIPQTNLSPEQATLLVRLREKRTQLAKQRNVPAYIIFSDRSLEEMARLQPRNEAAFADIHGVGAAKLEKFAAIFLEIMTE